ncbi:MAG: T9SS C-terminal target domain-containing protein [Winogradskyella sp.]|uniref:T9SS type A sorting domain-containing protein n=1 Tax=Winogradskyella sp. TaxID=1883156 RepID=UPI000F3B88AB|nr:T9SS type A sorting domain-containing protein [Winogradskyella sp.]RNC87062.1 MAG: T9SS C-terminal target domain-containing protein [Winogradskyella sp.]
MKKFYLQLALLFFFQFGFSQISFEDRLIFHEDSHALSASCIRVVDINGDGNQDILSSSIGQIVWFDNKDGDGIFHSTEVESTFQIYSVYGADIDGDSDIDIVAAIDSNTANERRIVWYENLDGLGNFGPQNLITSSVNRPRDVYIADIDSDGYPDVVSVSLNDGKIAWYKNTNGLGSFGSQNIIGIQGGATSVVVADMDNDNDNDIVFATDGNGGGVYWIENLNSQTADFGTIQLIASYPFDGYDQVVVADIDNDSDLDILAVYSSNVSWYENLDGNGNFSGAIITTEATLSASVYAEDLDGDNDIDVMSASFGSGINKISWYENLDGMGSFGSQQNLTTSASSANYVSAGDFDGDGDFDIVSSELVWYENLDGLGDFSMLEKSVSNYFSNPKSIDLCDLDNDGDLDILANTRNVINWYPNDDGEYRTRYLLDFPSAGIGDKVYPVDIDGDLDIDVLGYETSSRDIFWYENLDGNGNFDEPTIVENQTFNFANFTHADIDGDNDQDIIICTGGLAGGEIFVHENINGRFEDEVLVFDQNGVEDVISIIASDIDSDGDVDLILGVDWGSSYGVFWTENLDGNGTFGPRNQISSSSDFDELKHMSLADVDGDSDLDILIAHEEFFSSEVSLYRNSDGLGDFSSSELIISQNSNSISTAQGFDVDLDGNIDIITGGSKITWYRNMDGDGDFGLPLTITDNFGSKDFSVADVDGDNDFDIVSATGLLQTGTLYWCENFLYDIGNEISGTITYSANGQDCQSSEFINQVMVVADNGDDSFSTFSSENGSYSLGVNEGDFETTMINNLPSYYTVDPVSEISSFTGVNNTDIIDFCITPISTVNDVNIVTYPNIDDPRPGFDTSYQLVFNNNGTTQLSGDITFEFDDSKLQFLSASETVTSQTSNSLTFNYADLNPFETRTIDLEFNVFAPPITNINDILVSTASITPISGDATENDNTFELNQTVIGSYDPNDIRVLEGDEVLIDDADKYLHYIIRFQNTGTASAINVRVDHILDDQLDWTTMQLQSLSHNGRVEITDGNSIEFIFNNINLPDSSTDEANSHGYITFKIKPKNDVVVGDIVNGVADIYFDFNPAIVTNTVSTEFVNAALSIDDFETNKISIYPNPTNNTLYITSKLSVNQISVYDMNGRLLRMVSLNSNTFEYALDVKNLIEGIYFLKLESDNALQTLKFVKN